MIEEYKLYKLGTQKVAGLWKPPFIRMKRPTSKSNLHRNGAADKETSGGESTQNQELLTHIENQDWPNLIIGEVAGRGRVVQATQIIEKSKYVCNFDGLVLEPEACETFLEKAEAHSNDPVLGRTEYCMVFKFDGRKYGKGFGKWMINANNEPESVGLKPSFGRLISHCRKHPNLRLIQLTIEGNPYVLLETNCKILPGEELMSDYGDRATGLEDFMQYRNCICSKCAN